MIELNIKKEKKIAIIVSVLWIFNDLLSLVSNGDRFMQMDNTSSDL